MDTTVTGPLIIRAMQLIAFSYSQATITTVNYAATGTIMPTHGVLQTDTRETVACLRVHDVILTTPISYASKRRY